MQGQFIGDFGFYPISIPGSSHHFDLNDLPLTGDCKIESYLKESESLKILLISKFVYGIRTQIRF